MLAVLQLFISRTRDIFIAELWQLNQVIATRLQGGQKPCSVSRTPTLAMWFFLSEISSLFVLFCISWIIRLEIVELRNTKNPPVTACGDISHDRRFNEVLEYDKGVTTTIGVWLITLSGLADAKTLQTYFRTSKYFNARRGMLVCKKRLLCQTFPSLRCSTHSELQQLAHKND